MDPSFNPGENPFVGPENLPFPPQQSKKIKDEEEENSIHEIVYQTNEPLFNNDYDVDREIKDELMDEPLLSHQNDDSLHDFNIDDFGNYEPTKEDDSRVKIEEKEDERIESFVTEDHPTTSARSSDHMLFSEPRKALDTKRIQTIRDVISSIVELSSLKGVAMAQLKTALYVICIGESTVNEASKMFNICESTLRFHMGTARLKLGENIFPLKFEGNEVSGVRQPINSSRLMEASRNEQRKYPLKAKQVIDSSFQADVEKCTNQVMNAIRYGPLRERTFRAVVAAVMREKTIREASNSERLNIYFVLPFVTNVRQILEHSHPKMSTVNAPDNTNITIGDGILTVDGITVPRSIARITQHLKTGQLDYSRARPFEGTEAELIKKHTLIIRALSFQGMIIPFVRGIMRVMDGKTVLEASKLCKVNSNTLAIYADAIQIFIDFGTTTYTNGLYRAITKAIAQEVPMVNGGMEPPQPLPIPPVKMMNEWEIKKEEIKEEPIEPPL